MKRQYVPTSLGQYINESKSITLKRGYKDRKPVVVGANAPIRNQVLAYVAEGQRVAATDLKRFVAGLNETNANPNAAANMWLRRNGKFFITESKGGVTYFKLSQLGQRIVNTFAPRKMNEQYEDEMTSREFVGFVQNLIDSGASKAMAERELKALFDANPYMHEETGEIKGKDKYKEGLDLFIDHYSMRESKKYDFKDPKTDEPGIIDDEDEVEEGCSKTNEGKKEKVKPRLGGKLDPKLHNLLDQGENKDEGELDGFAKEISEERRERIEKLIENIQKRKESEESVNEAKDEGEEIESSEEDELSFDDLDLSGEDEKGEEGDKKGEEGESEEGDDAEEGDEDLEDIEGEEGEPDEDEKVEITEFIITVDDVDSAIEELKELGVDAEKVLAEGVVNEAEEGEGDDLELGGEEEGDEEGDEDEEKYSETEISVPAEQWDALKGWLEDKGVDIEEMFGGEIEVEDVEEEGEDLEVDLEGEDGEEDLEVDLEDEEGEGSDELELDLGDEEDPELEEDLTGLHGTKHEDETNNLIKGAKQVVINYK